MNIVFVVDFKLSGRGGMETAISLIYHEFIQRHKVAVVLMEESDDSAWEEGILTVPIFRKISKNIPKNYLLNTYTSAMSNIIQTLQPVDMIISLGPVGTRVAKMAVDRMNMPTLVVSWLHFNMDFYKNGLDDLQFADGHLSISEGQLIELQNVFPGKISKLVYNPVKFEDVELVRRPANPTFLYVGRLVKVKRVDRILEALSPLNDYNWEFHIVGDGEEYRTLVDLSKQLGIEDRIVWHGWSIDPWKAVPSCTSLLLSSETEPFGLVLIEALSRGIPVISSDCPHRPREIVNKSNGLLYPPNAPEELTAILKRVMDNDQILPSQESCRESVSKYSVKTIAARYEKALLDIAEYYHRSLEMSE